jgi:hypothetical protein
MKHLGFFAFFFIFVTTAIYQDAAPEGRWEGEIEIAERPIILSVDFDEKQGWLSTVGTKAFPLSDLTSEAGEIHFKLRLGMEVVSVRAMAEAKRLRGTAVFANLQGRVLAQGKFLLGRITELPAVGSREEAWRQDFDVALSRFLPYDRTFSDTARIEFRQRIERLKNSVARRSDAELMVELARAVALSRNAHTRLYLVRNRTEVRRLPIRVWWFRDGLYVVRATDNYKELLGCQVEEIGETKVATAAEKVSGIKPGNASWQWYMSAYMLTSPEILAGSQIIANAERIPLELRCSGKKTNRAVVPLPLHKSSAPAESWWDLSPFAKRNESTPLSTLAPETAPLYLRKPDVHYWFEYLPQRRILYFQYNRSQEMKDGQSLKDFSQELLRAADQGNVFALVVDLRFNTGGNANLATPIMKSLQEKLTGKSVFVITGRATFSAGITHAAQWKRWSAKVVGEHVGDELDFWAEGGNVELPNSKLTVHYSNGFHCYSRRDYLERKPYFLDLDVDTLAPDFPVETTWAEYLSGRDPAMELIEGEIARHASKGPGKN